MRNAVCIHSLLADVLDFRIEDLFTLSNEFQWSLSVRCYGSGGGRLWVTHERAVPPGLKAGSVPAW